MQQLQEQQQQQQQGQEAKFEANEAEMSLTTQLPSRGSEYNIKTGPQYNSASSTRQRETGRQTVRFHSWHWTLFFFFLLFFCSCSPFRTDWYILSISSESSGIRAQPIFNFLYIFSCVSMHGHWTVLCADNGLLSIKRTDRWIRRQDNRENEGA